MANGTEPLATFSLLELLTHRLHHFIDLTLRRETCAECRLGELDQAVAEVSLSLHGEIGSTEDLCELNLFGEVLRDLNFCYIKL